MTRETIERFYKLEAKKEKFEQFVEALKINRELTVQEWRGSVSPCGLSLYDSVAYYPFAHYSIDSADDKEFIEHVLTYAEERLSQIKKEIEEL